MPGQVGQALVCVCLCVSVAITNLIQIQRSLIVLKRLVLVILCLSTLLSLFCCATTDSAKEEKDAEGVRRLGEGYLAEGNVTAALGQFLKAEEIYDKDPFLHYDLGLAYFGKEEFDLAISHFKRAVELDPDYSEAYNAMGRVHGRLEQWDMAISSFEEALSSLLYTTPHLALNNLGEAYRHKKEYQRAIGYYKEALRKHPHFPNAYRGMGLTYMEMGDYKEAVASLEKAVQYAPRSPRAYFDLGRAYAGLSETKKAVSAFEKVRMLVPDTSLADRALSEIRRLGR